LVITLEGSEEGGGRRKKEGGGGKRRRKEEEEEGASSYQYCKSSKTCNCTLPLIISS
jgi:hypothetical protein